MPKSPKAKNSICKKLWNFFEKYFWDTQLFKKVFWRKIIPLSIVVLLLLGFNWKYKFLYPLFERFKEGSSVEISSILKLGEIERPEVRIEHAFESIPQCEIFRKIRNDLVDIREGYYQYKVLIEQNESKNILDYENFKTLYDRYNRILDNWVCGNPLNKMENPSTYDELKNFFEKDFKVFVNGFNEKLSQKPEELKNAYPVLRFIAAIYALFEREKCKNKDLGIEIEEKSAEKYYCKIIDQITSDEAKDEVKEKAIKYEANLMVYCNYIYYLCWVNKDMNGKLIDEYDKKAKEIIEKARITFNELPKIQKEIMNSEESEENKFNYELNNLYYEVYLNICSNYYEYCSGKQLSAIHNLEQEQKDIIEKVKKYIEKQKDIITKHIMPDLYMNQINISIGYYKCNLLPRDFRVQKAIYSLSEIIDRWEHLKPPDKIEILCILGTYYEDVRKYEDAEKCYKDAFSFDFCENEEVMRVKSMQVYPIVCLCRIKLMQTRKYFYDNKYNDFIYTLSELRTYYDKLVNLIEKDADVSDNQKKSYRDFKDDLTFFLDIADGCAELKIFENHPFQETTILDSAKKHFQCAKGKIKSRKINGNACGDLRVKAERWLGYTYFLEAKYGCNKGSIDVAIKRLEKAERYLEKDMNTLEAIAKKIQTVEINIPKFSQANEPESPFTEEEPCYINKSNDLSSLNDLYKTKDIDEELLKKLRKNHLIVFLDDLEVYHLLGDAYMFRFKSNRDKGDREKSCYYLDKYEEYLRSQNRCRKFIEDKNYFSRD